MRLEALYLAFPIFLLVNRILVHLFCPCISILDLVVNHLSDLSVIDEYRYQIEEVGSTLFQLFG